MRGASGPGLQIVRTRGHTLLRRRCFPRRCPRNCTKRAHMLIPRTASGRRLTAALAATAAVATPILLAGVADAAIVATVPLATSAEYAVLGGSAVTNTGPSVLDGS